MRPLSYRNAAWLLVLLLTAGVIFIATPVGGDALAARGSTSVSMEVAPDLATFSATREVAEGENFPTGPFYIEGSLYPLDTLNADGTVPAGAEAIGTYRCWGWIVEGMNGAAVVNQSYELYDSGSILVNGYEATEFRIVTGGTGDFVGARGIGTTTTINAENLTFSIAFDIE